MGVPQQEIDNNTVAMKQDRERPSKHSLEVVVDPLKRGALITRENRDMSEGLEKSRSHKLGGLVSMLDHEAADSHSQLDSRALKLHQKQQDTTVDSG